MINFRMKMVILFFSIISLFNSCFAQKKSSRIEYLIEIIDSLKKYEEETEQQNSFFSPIDRAVNFQRKLYQLEEFNPDSLGNCLLEVSTLLIRDVPPSLDSVSRDILIRISFNLNLKKYTELIDFIISSGFANKELILSKLVFTQEGHYTNKIIENWSSFPVQKLLKKAMELENHPPHEYSELFFKKLNDIYTGKAYNNKEDDWVYVVDEGFYVALPGQE